MTNIKLSALLGSTILLGILSAPINAQTPTPMINVVINTIENQENVADKQQLRATLSEFTSLKGEFSQQILSMQGEELQSASGELLLQKPQKLKWSISSPDESQLIADGSAVYNIDPWLTQITILDQAQLTKSNPLMLLISDDPSQWEQVSVAYQDNSYTITSLLDDSPITTLILKFDAQNKLSSVVSFDRQQQQNSLTFNNVLLNEGVSETDFVFDIDDSWKVDDQRAQSTN